MVVSRGRRRVCINWYYIRLISFYFTLLIPPNDSGVGDKSTPSCSVGLPTIHLVGINGCILVTWDRVGALTAVVRRIHTVGPTVILVADVGCC